MSLVNRLNKSRPLFIPFEDRLLFRAGAYAKCLPGYGARNETGCGATLLTELDWYLHVCDTKATRRGAMRGRTDDKVVQM